MAGDGRRSAGLILAGGGGRRMGGHDKGFLTLDGMTLAERAVARLAPQVGALAVSANGDPARYAALSLPVLADAVEDAGPLAGILAGLRWAAGLTPAPECLATVAVDTPFFPDDLVARLVAAADREAVAVAVSGGRRHATFALWPVALADRLAAHMAATDDRAVTGFLATCATVEVAFAVDDGAPDPFFNVNTPDDLTVAGRYV